MDIPLLAGTYVDANASLRVRHPVNVQPVPGAGSTNAGYMRPGEGVIPFGAGGPGVDRGGIVWEVDGLHYRVMGASLVTVDAAGVVAIVSGTALPGTLPVRLDFSFTLLGILVPYEVGVSGTGALYFWDGTNLTKVTDVNIPANLVDMVWVDSYWMVTDGAIAAVSNLTAPTTFNLLKYTGLNNPDMIRCTLKVNGQVQLVATNEIDPLQNVGGQFFPFSFVLPGVITKGVVGTRAACVFQSTIGGVIIGTVAFVGNGRNEAPSVYLGLNAQAIRIADAEVDELLMSYTPAQLSTIILEAIVYRGGQFLHVRLPDRTVVYDAIASSVAQQPVWHTLVTATDGYAQNRASFATLAYGVWVVGDPQSNALGVMSASDSSHWGMTNRWELNTPLLDNDGKSTNISQMELVILNGAVNATVDPTIALSWTEDGQNYSQRRFVKSGKVGDRRKRVIWFDLGVWREFRSYKIEGDSNSRVSARKLRAELQPLGV